MSAYNWFDLKMNFIAKSQLRKMGIEIPNTISLVDQNIRYVLSNLASVLSRADAYKEAIELSATNPIYSCYIDKTKEGLPLSPGEIDCVFNAVSAELKNHFRVEREKTAAGLFIKVYLQ